MPLNKQPYKGARDFYPEQKRLQKYIFSTWRKTAELFGYNEYDAPILEPLEIYLAKSGEEIVSEQTYLFQDRGGREVVIRPEMTPTVSRMVAAKRQELAYPLRWYSVPNLWRYEKPQRGRLREHWQLNIDLFGIEGLAAEHEIVLLADQVMKQFNATDEMYTIRLNSRKFSDFMLRDFLGATQKQAETLSKLIDKMSKMDYAKFKDLIKQTMDAKQWQNQTADKLLDVLQIKSLDDLPEKLANHGSIKRLRQLMDLLESSGIKNAVFDPSLMRGFDYYTDIVFEVFDNHPDNNRSMFGGGRYDGLVGLFGVDPIPTIGFGAGDITFQNFLELHGLTPKLTSEVNLQVLLIGDVYKDAQSIIQKLRGCGINLAVDSSDRSLDKKLKNALKRDIRYLLFVGEDELTSQSFRLKDTKTAKETKQSLDQIIEFMGGRNESGKINNRLLD